MIDSDLDDTHLCIKCSSAVVGLTAYIEHRKSQCNSINATAHRQKPDQDSQHTASSAIISATRVNLDHTYDAFSFTEPEPEPEPPSSYANKAEHGGKTSKSLSDSYDLSYELGADVFFSSLQLQSVQSSGPSSGGKQSLQPSQSISLQRMQKSEHNEVSWMSDTQAESNSGQQQNSDTLMKAVRDISETKKPYEDFKPISFGHESPDVSDVSEEEEVDVEIDADVDADVDDDEDDYDPITSSHATGGKWKLSTMHHSPPVVPESHTGGKWRPENRPILRVAHTQLARLSHSWDEPTDDMDAVEVNEGQHPPAEHTKGKWIPGTKMQRLEYKEDVVELAKSANQEYWCNICCRRLKSKTFYENHLKTVYHLKRAEPEQQLEKAALSKIQHGDLSKIITKECFDKKLLMKPATVKATGKKRNRRPSILKCELCKHSMLRHLVGKHLISHYHYRRMQLNPSMSLHMIIDNIHSIVLQSPFQCRPCRFYANTEEMFLQHWNSPEHLDTTEGPGKFWCSFCHFECEDNNQMRRHLLCTDHKEVILAINRSVPICISKKVNIDCSRCRQSFRYNAELRKHNRLYHPGIDCSGTASDDYQNLYKCKLCAENFRSKIALQRHEKYKHSIAKYFCSICKLEFNTATKARRHRKTAEHRLKAASTEKVLTHRKQNVLAKTKSPVKSIMECEKCSFAATSEVEAMLHELSHPKSEFAKSRMIVKASKKREFAAETTTKHPTIIKSQKTIKKCKDCVEVFTNLNELKCHREANHPLLRHTCLSCGESFALSQSLGRHSRICQPTASTSSAAATSTTSPDEFSKTWSCGECDFSATYESDLIFHRLHHTFGPIRKDQRIACPLCGKEFRKHSLYCHIRQHTKEKIFECDICKAKFARRHNLKDHMKKIHKSTPKPEDIQKGNTGTTPEEEQSKEKEKHKPEESSFQCDTCGKMFMTKYLLQKHSTVHNAPTKPGRPYACTYEGCIYEATTTGILHVHMASHSQEKLKCQHPECTYIGKSALHLKRHLRSHGAPSELYACNKCDFKARIKGHINRHMLSHTGEKPVQCPHCDFRCSSFDNLRKHVLKTNKHPGKFIYECNECTVLNTETKDKTFCTNSFREFQIHLKTAHGSQAHR